LDRLIQELVPEKWEWEQEKELGMEQELVQALDLVSEPAMEQVMVPYWFGSRKNYPRSQFP
jgi:hypothetical protein